MPRGIYPGQREAGRQGGIVSGMVRRERILNAYMDIVRQYGVYEALRVCRNKSWLQGYKARQKHEERHGYRKDQKANKTSQQQSQRT